MRINLKLLTFYLNLKQVMISKRINNIDFLKKKIIFYMIDIYIFVFVVAFCFFL